MTKKVMIDAGHYSYYNRSCVFKNYYEGNMSWELQNLLKKELEDLGIKVDVTRSLRDKDLKLYDRGYKAKGYDLFVSLHSNACDDSDVDRIVIIKGYDQKEDHAKILAKAVSNCMKIENYQIYERMYGKGEYYGVLRGAKAAGVNDRFIIEHSFHTNLKAAKWLYNSDNLEKLAKVEAVAIAKILGISVNVKTKYLRVLKTVNLHSKADFTKESICGKVEPGTALTIVETVKREGTDMYKTKAGTYITSSSKYIEVFTK